MRVWLEQASYRSGTQARRLDLSLAQCFSAEGDDSLPLSQLNIWAHFRLSQLGGEEMVPAPVAGLQRCCWTPHNAQYPPSPTAKNYLVPHFRSAEARKPWLPIPCQKLRTPWGDSTWHSPNSAQRRPPSSQRTLPEGPCRAKRPSTAGRDKQAETFSKRGFLPALLTSPLSSQRVLPAPAAPRRCTHRRLCPRCSLPRGQAAVFWVSPPGLTPPLLSTGTASSPCRALPDPGTLPTPRRCAFSHHPAYILLSQGLSGA